MLRPFSLRSCVVWLLAALPALLWLATPIAAEDASAVVSDAGRPNLLLVTIDTLRKDHLSAYGYPWETSPNLDALAEEGVLFERAYSAIPVTGPSHCTILTGLLPQSHGSYRNGVQMNAKAVSLAQILQAADYDTAAFVSGWTLKPNLTGLDRGFDTYSAEFSDRYGLVNSQRPANEVTDEALEWLGSRTSDKPFFLWVHYFDPHEPYELVRGFEELAAAQEDGSRDRRSRKIVRYDSEIAFADAHMGRIIKSLRKRSLLDQTLVVVTADHGEAFGEHGYKGHGRKVHEPGIQVPLVVRYPEAIAAGRRVTQLAGLIDLSPTLHEIFGLPANPAHQGISLAPWLLSDRAPAERPREIHAVAYPGTVGHMPRWVRGIFNRKKPNRPLQIAYLWESWKFVLHSQRGHAYLHDLQTDPDEKQDLLEEHPEYLSLRARLEDWFERTRDEEGETTLTAGDLEHLRSLGYAGDAAAAKAASRPEEAAR